MKPMVISNFEYWKDVFVDVAVFANPLDPKEIQMSINFLIKNKDKADFMGKNGYNQILEQYSWEAESKRLVENV